MWLLGTWTSELRALRWARPIGTSCVFRYSSTSALWLILHFWSHNCLHSLDGCRRRPVWSARNRGPNEMTTDYYRAEQGKKIIGTSVLFFAQGLTWFGFDSPGGIFTLQPLNLNDAFFRAEIVIGAIVAACGVLVWRSASRKLSLANYIVLLSCVAVLLLCASKVSEWVYLLDHHKGFAMNDLGIFIIDIMIPVCILVFGGWWADSTFMRERFRRYMPSSRSVK